ncbi:MAG: ribosome maturation factor RimP [Candidatus Alcyoniella australis]|nr:ribosome maturation factor RimP [Candidatus Alcyoniella australis]
MDSTQLILKIAAITEPVCQSLGVDLYHVELAGSVRRPTVRIYIDAMDGVGIQDCVEVSRRLSPALDVEDLFSGAYDLEVSSPGMDRPLRFADDFIKYQGRMAKIRLREPLDGRRKFKGTIVQCAAETLQLDVDGQLFDLPLEGIERANLEIEL